MYKEIVQQRTNNPEQTTAENEAKAEDELSIPKVEDKEVLGEPEAPEPTPTEKASHATKSSNLNVTDERKFNKRIRENLFIFHFSSSDLI